MLVFIIVLIINWMYWIKDHINWVALYFFWFRLNCSLLSRLSQGHGDQVLHFSLPSWHNWGHKGCLLLDFHWTVPGFAFPRAGDRRNWHNSLKQFKAQPGYLHPAFITFLPASSSQRDHIPLPSSRALPFFPLRKPWRVGGCGLAPSRPLLRQYDWEISSHQPVRHWALTSSGVLCPREQY